MEGAAARIMTSPSSRSPLRGAAWHADAALEDAQLVHLLPPATAASTTPEKTSTDGSPPGAPKANRQSEERLVGTAASPTGNRTGGSKAARTPDWTQYQPEQEVDLTERMRALENRECVYVHYLQQQEHILRQQLAELHLELAELHRVVQKQRRDLDAIARTFLGERTGSTPPTPGRGRHLPSTKRSPRKKTGGGLA